MFIVIASDSFYNTMNPHFFAETIALAFRNKTQKLLNTCKEMTRQSSLLWSNMGVFYRDDITITIHDIH